MQNIKFIGNIKLSSKLNIENFKNTNENFFNKKKFGLQLVLIAGEEFFCLKTHELLKEIDNLVTIIIPRHITRSNEIKLVCDSFKLRSQIVEKNSLIDNNAEIIIVNSLERSMNI